jgi:hypothetical protein
VQSLTINVRGDFVVQLQGFREIFKEVHAGCKKHISARQNTISFPYRPSFRRRCIHRPVKGAISSRNRISLSNQNWFINKGKERQTSLEKARYPEWCSGTWPTKSLKSILTRDWQRICRWHTALPASRQETAKYLGPTCKCSCKLRPSLHEEPYGDGTQIFKRRNRHALRPAGAAGQTTTPQPGQVLCCRLQRS